MIHSNTRKLAPWKIELKRILPLWGHRNWIVIADAAYPAQSNPGIETIATEADHLVILKAMLAALKSSKHVRANIYLDSELNWLTEEDAPGATQYQRKLSRYFGNQDIKSLPHDKIIAKLDASGKLFRVLILKSTLTIPYTSVFLELDCGYWDSDAEKRLRDSMKKTFSRRKGAVD